MQLEANPPERATCLRRTTGITQCYINVNGYYTMLHKGQSRIHSFIRTPDSCLIDFLPDRFLTGPATATSNPRERFPTRPGTTGLRIFCPAGRFTLTGLSRNANITLTWIPPTLRDHLSALTTGLPGIPGPPSHYMN